MTSRMFRPACRRGSGVGEQERKASRAKGGWKPENAIYFLAPVKAP